jgi:hypothetical protein
MRDADFARKIVELEIKIKIIASADKADINCQRRGLRVRIYTVAQQY